METMDNEMKLSFLAKSQNESFARVAVAAFITGLDPTLSEVADIKTAVSEAVTNAIIHGYDNNGGEVYIHCTLKGKTIEIEIADNGLGIPNIEEAKTPLYTSKPELERSGMGFTVMETFMDEMTVQSEPGKGTQVKLIKCLG